MRGGDFESVEALWTRSDDRPEFRANDDASGFRADVSSQPGGALRPSLARLEKFVCTSGRFDESSGALSRGRQRASGSGRADGGALGLASGVASDGGPRFDQNVPPGGYAWWYVDAFSEDEQFGLSIIAFIGSVFSPYYAWRGHRDPLDHCAMNVALYGPRGARWAMTERRRASLRRDIGSLEIGPSAMRWDGRALEIDVNEISAPWPRRLRGHVRVEPETINPRAFTLESGGDHFWRPIAPIARVSAEFSEPDIKWSGSGYFDSNFGGEPLGAGFRRWTWSRARTRGGSAILYEAERRREGPLQLSLEFDRSGGFAAFAPPPVVALPRSRWRIERTTRSEDGDARIIGGFEDTPFYSRSRVEHALLGERVSSMHESLDLDRFANPVVRAMLPFRMPRI